MSRRCFAALAAVGYDGWISFEDFSTARPLFERTRDNLAYVRSRSRPTARTARSDPGAVDRHAWPSDGPRLAFSSRMTLRGRGPRVLLLLVVFMGSLAAPAHADTGDDLARARSRLASRAEGGRRGAAHATKPRSPRTRSSSRTSQLTQDRITDAEGREETLQQTVQEIAVRAYVGAGEPVAGALLFGGDDVLDFGRTTRLLDSANAPNVDAIDELEGVHADLERDRDHLAASKDESDELLAQLDTETKTVQDELLVADRTRQAARDAVRAGAAATAALARRRAPSRGSRARASHDDDEAGRGLADDASRARSPTTTKPPSTPTTPDDQTVESAAASGQPRVSGARRGDASSTAGARRVRAGDRTRAST